VIYDWIAFDLQKLYTHESSPVHTNFYASAYHFFERVENNPRAL
jgi:hypothetical protein